MKSINKATYLDLALVFLTALLWASAFSAIKVAVVETGPYWLAASRVLIALLVLVPVCLFKGIQLPAGKMAWGILFAVTLLNIVIPFLLISWAQLTITASETSVLLGASPFFAIILLHFFTSDDRINRYKIIAVILGLCGVMLILGANAIKGAAEAPIWQLAAVLVSSLCYVSAGVLLRKITIGSIQFTTLAFAIAGLIHFILAYLIDGLPEELPNNTTLIAIVWLGLFPTGLAYILRFALIQKIGFSTFAIGQNMIPVLGVIIAATLLGEQISFIMVISLILVVLGMFIARQGVGNSND